MKSTLLIFITLLFSFSGLAQKYFSVTDDRDGQTYKAVEFEIPLPGGITVSRSWMLENSNYAVEKGSYCYSDVSEYCGKFGRLYDFEAALQACPEGWRIPTRKDWFLLFSIFGGVNHAGTPLKEDGDSGMNFLLGGYMFEGGYYNKIGLEGNYWDSQDKGSHPDGLMTFYSSRVGVHYGAVTNKTANSCRCIKIH